MFISKLFIVASLFSNCFISNHNSQLQLKSYDKTAEAEKLVKGFKKSKIIDNNYGQFKFVRSTNLNNNKKAALYSLDPYSLSSLSHLPKELYVKGDYFKYTRGTSNSSYEFSVTNVKLESNSFSVNVAAEIGSEYAKALVELGVKLENTNYESITDSYRIDFDKGYYSNGYYSADLYLYYAKNKLVIDTKVRKSRTVTKTERYTVRYISSYNNKGQPIWTTETRYRTYNVIEYYDVWESEEFIYYTPFILNGSVVKIWEPCYTSTL